MTDGRHDFDFLFGDWTVHNRRLKLRFQDCDDWEIFDATAQIQPILGGIGHTDEMVVPLPAGPEFRGFTLRLYDPETDLWSIYWADSVACRLFPPLTGRFDNGVALFYGDDIEGGQPVKVRFTWDSTDTNAPRWQQEMSLDGGASWEFNWEMRLERLPS